MDPQAEYLRISCIMLQEVQPTPLPEAYQKLRNKRILVTGAAGFIGGALFRRLVSYGLDVTGTVLYPHEARAITNLGHKAQVLDLTSNGSWDDLLAGIDIVFHIAAMFQEVEHSEDLYDKANNLGAVKLAETAARAGVSRFIHCSTVGVHGDVLEIPATEHSPFHPMDLYHRTKLAGELALVEFAKSEAIGSMVLTINRPAMVYGPGDIRMLKLFKTILNGSFRMIGSGKVLAHLGHIDDQTDSFLHCAVAPDEMVHGEAFNIASDIPLTLNDLAAIIAEEGKVKLSGIHIPLRPVWLAALLCEIICKPFKIKPPLFRRRIGFFTHNRAFDLSKARERLGYISKVTNRQGVRNTIAWIRKFDLA